MMYWLDEIGGVLDRKCWRENLLFTFLEFPKVQPPTCFRPVNFHFQFSRSIDCGVKRAETMIESGRVQRWFQKGTDEFFFGFGVQGEALK